MCVAADTRILARCFEDEDILNRPKLAKELIFYDYIDALWGLAQCDIVCANDWDGYEVPDFDPGKTSVELFADHHYVRTSSGWQKRIWHLEKRELVDCDARPTPPRFLFRHTETGQIVESDEMLPPEVAPSADG